MLAYSISLEDKYSLITQRIY